MSATSSRNNGFTLLEVLIAIVLLGLLAGALYASYFTVLRARDNAAEGMETRRELAATLDLLRREISSAKFNSNDPQKRWRFVVEDRDNFGKPASTLELTSLTPPVPSAEGRRESGVINVQYRLAEQNKRWILTRKEQDVMFPSATVPVYPQMETISAFLVECYDGSKWLRSWDTALIPGLPKQVRITIQVEEAGKPVEFSVYAKPMVMQ